MNKLALIEVLQKEAGLTKIEAARVVNTFFNEMASTPGNGDRAEIRGFCSFFVKEYDGYTVRNPKSGERVKIKAKKLPFFKCGTELKKRVE